VATSPQDLNLGDLQQSWRAPAAQPGADSSKAGVFRPRNRLPNPAGVELKQKTMASYRKILIHIVFHTKYNIPAIDPKHKTELYRYIWGIIKNKNCVLFRINSVEDHIHILSDLHSSVSLANFVKDIKVASSIWMKQSGLFPKFRGWAEGFGAFSYAYRDRQKIINYIRKQEEHHKKKSFKKEYINLLKEHGMKLDEKKF
jgi:REP element-mobilizing transposase RayT